MASEMIYANQEELDAGLAKWQPILRLLDWEIEVNLVRAKDMHSRDNHGEMWDFPAYKRAKINVAEAVDYESSLKRENDMEVILVHELIHIHMCGYTNEVRDANEELSKRLWTQEEQMVNMMAFALVALDRKT